MPKEVRQRVHAAAMAEDVELDDIEEDVEPITHHVGDAASNSSDDSNTAEMEDGVSVLAPGAIRSPRQAAASDLKQRAGDVVGCIQELRSRVAHDEAPGNAKKKLISVNRIGLQARTHFPTTLNVPPPAQQEMLPLFDNAGDDVIKFHRSDDEDGEGTGSDEDVDAKTLQARRKRKIDRDFDEATEERHAAEEEDEEAERWNEDSSSNSDVFEGSSGSSSSASDGSDDDEEDPSSSEEEVEVKRASPKKTSASVSQTLGRSAYGGITFESHYNRNADSRTAFGCHHTLLGLTGPQTIRGPCAVFGVFNEASCNGFLLGKKNFMVGPKDVAVLQPMSKLSSSASQLSISELLAARQERLSKAVAIPHPAQPGHAAGTKRNDEVWGVGSTHSPEVKFGAIDWDWVANTLQSWLTRLAADKSMSVVLVVEKYLPGELMTRRVQFAQKASHIDRYGSGDSMLIPSCFARKNVPAPVEPALLPVFRKMMISAHSVAVVGGQNIGKSTLARSLTNGFVSQQGVCYWLDLDLGRPEFGVSGSISISRVHRPLVKEHDIEASEWIKVIHVGGARMQCPETMAIALDALCSYVEAHHRTWLKPLVINTHGWIQSSGRRSTVEALRRLHPQHVVQLMRHGDPKWVMPEVIFEPNCGLNRRVVSDRFLAGIPTCMPEAQGRRNAADQEGSNTSANINAPQMEVHSLTVVRLDTVYKTADSRKDNWRRYFYPLTASSAPTATSMLDIALPPGNGEADELPVLVLPHDLVGGASLEEFIGATAQSVVALCCASSSSLSSSSQLLRKLPKKRDREAAAVKDAVVRPQEAIHGAQFLCYGFVVSSWSQQVHTTSSPPRSLRVAVPLPQSSLTSLLARYSAAEPQRLVVYACPYEAFDTSFLVPQQTKTTK